MSRCREKCHCYKKDDKSHLHYQKKHHKSHPHEKHRGSHCCEKCPKVPKCLKAQKCPQVIHVGANREYKQISDAISSLKRNFILRDVVIKVDSGVYNPFIVDGYLYVNDGVGTVTIQGDNRDISAKTYLNLSCPGPFPDQTLTYTPDGENTIIEINPAPDLVGMGLKIGDKVVLYDNDEFVAPTTRSVEKTVLKIENNKFTVEGDINNTANGSAVTFLPNVYVKSFSVDSGGYAISISKPCKIIGVTAEEPDDKTMDNIVGNIVVNCAAQLDSCVARSLTQSEKDPLAFLNAHALLVNNSNKLLLDNFTTLGTGSNNEFLIPGVVSICESVAELRDVNIIGTTSVGDTELAVSDSELLLSGNQLNLITNLGDKSKFFIFQSNVKTTQMTINILTGLTGIDISNGSTFNGNPQLCIQLVGFGIKLSKNTIFNYSNFPGQSFISGVRFSGIAAKHSNVDIAGLTIDINNAEGDPATAASAKEISEIVLRNVVVKKPTPGTVEYCADDSSTIVNDGVKLNPPACN